MIFPPSPADVDDMLMHLLCIGRLRTVTKLRAAEDEAELDAYLRTYRRDVKRRSRDKGKR